MADSSEIARRVGAYYTGKLEQHGPTARGVDWNSETSQLLRFDQLLKVAAGARRFSLNDYGCGYAALLEHLDETGHEVVYHGYDVSAAMVASAIERHGGRPRCGFGTDPAAIPVADVTVASGIFNVLAGSDGEDWEDYVRATVCAMAELSRKGVAFNMLTSYSDPERMTDRLHYADPCRVFDWCKRELSRDVALLHDYGLYEFTVIIRFDAKGRLA